MILAWYERTVLLKYDKQQRWAKTEDKGQAQQTIEWYNYTTSD